MYRCIIVKLKSKISNSYFDTSTFVYLGQKYIINDKTLFFIY